MRRIYCLLLFLCPLFSLGQRNYQPATISKSARDTLSGFVDYQEWIANPKFIDFKKNNQSTEQAIRYTPETITYFNISGYEAYQSYSGPVSTDETNIARLEGGRDTSSQMVSAFLKVLASGKNLTLYAYTDDIKTRFFIKESADVQPHELIYRVYYSLVQDAQRTIYENTYKNELSILTEKYGLANNRTQARLERLNYNADDLTEVINYLNQVETKVTAEEKSSAAKGFIIYAGVGANLATYVPTGNYATAANHTTSTSFLPLANVGVNFYFNPATQRAALRVELFAAASRYNTSGSGSNLAPLTEDFTQLTYSLTPYLTYNFYNTSGLRVYGGAGLVLSSYHYHNNIGSNASYFPVINSDVAGLLKAGITLNKKIDISVSYNTPTHISANDDYNGLKMNVIQAGINFWFSKN